MPRFRTWPWLLLGAVAIFCLEATTCGDPGAGAIRFLPMAPGDRSGDLHVEGVSCGIHGTLIEGTLGGSHLIVKLDHDVEISGDFGTVNGGSADGSMTATGYVATRLGAQGFGALAGWARCPGAIPDSPFNLQLTGAPTVAYTSAIGIGCPGTAPQALPSGPLLFGGTDPTAVQITGVPGTAALKGQVEPNGAFYAAAGGSPAPALMLGRLDAGSLQGDLYLARPGVPGCMVRYAVGPA